MWFIRLAALLSLLGFTVWPASAQTQVQPGRDIRWPPTCQANMPYAPSGNTCTSPTPWIDPTDPRFGAKCDNNTDDSAAFQAAINAIPPSGGTLLVHGYCVVNNLVIPVSLINDGSSFSLGVWIQGAGRNYSQLINRSTNLPTISAICPSGVNCWNFTMSDLEMMVGSNYNGWQLQTQNVSGVHLRSVSASGQDPTSGHTCGIDIRGQVGTTFTWNATIDDIAMNGCSILFDGMDDSYIHGGYIYPGHQGFPGRNYAISLINGQNIQISGMHEIGMPVGPVSGPCAGVLLQGTSFSVRIDGNFIDASSGSIPPSPSACGGIVFLGAANQTNIVNNIIHLSIDSGIEFQGAANQTVISSNQLNNAAVGVGMAGGLAQIKFAAASLNATIANNKFTQTQTLTAPDIAVSELAASTNIYAGNSVFGSGFSATPWSGINGGEFAPLAGVPIAGQAACIKSAGPPPIIGYCTNVVGAGGTCTCN